MVLRTPHQDEANVKSYLARLSISLEARAYGKSQPPPTGPDERSPVRNEDIIWSGTVDKEQEPTVTVREENVGDGHRSVLAIWSVTVKLSMPITGFGYFRVNVEYL